jgi:hypothetical protein
MASAYSGPSIREYTEALADGLNLPITSTDDGPTLLTATGVRRDGTLAEGAAVLKLWPHVPSANVGDDINVRPFAVAPMADGQVTYFLDIDDVSPEYVRDGMIEVEIDAYDMVTGEVLNTSTSLLSVTSTPVLAVDDTERWVDPELGEIEDSLIDFTDYANVSVVLNTLELLTGEGWTVDLLQEPDLLPLYCPWILKEKKNWWTKVGDSFPVDGDKGRTVYEGDHSQTTGIAAKAPRGVWSASGQKTIGSGFGVDFAWAATKRNHQVQTTYGRYYNCMGQERWRPIEQPGFARYTLYSSAPNWMHCGEVPAGTWRRTNSQHSSYEMNVGVINDITGGVALKASTNYGSKRKLEYEVAKKKKLCGSNDVPSKAARIQLKL